MDETEVVVDTNVPLVANGKADHVGWECVAACVRELRQVQANRRTLLDDKWLIIEEYRRNLSHSGSLAWATHSSSGSGRTRPTNNIAELCP